MTRKYTQYTFLILVLVALPCLATPAQAMPQAMHRIGVRTGLDMGLPSIVWESAPQKRTALTLALGYNRGFAGTHLAIGVKWYTQPELRGVYGHFSTTFGAGGSLNAQWSSLQASATAGYSWAVTDRWQAAIEAGPSIRVVKASTRAGHEIYARFTLPLLRLGLDLRY